MHIFVSCCCNVFSQKLVVKRLNVFTVRGKVFHTENPCHPSPQVDMHSVHFHGQILLTMGQHTDTVSMFPGSSTTALMTADNPGHWLLTCTVNDHLMGRCRFLATL